MNGVDTWLKRLLRPYRRAVKKLATMLDVPMPKKPVDHLKLVETSMRAQELRQKYQIRRSLLPRLPWRLVEGTRYRFRCTRTRAGIDDSLKGLSIDLTLDKCVTFTGDPRRLIEIFELMARQFVAKIGRVDQNGRTRLQCCFRQRQYSRRSARYFS